MLSPERAAIAAAQLGLGREANHQVVVAEVIVNVRLALPPITIHADDYNALVLSAELARRANRPHAGFLLAELRRARLCKRKELPPCVVSMGCTVTYRLASEEANVTR